MRLNHGRAALVVFSADGGFPRLMQTTNIAVSRAFCSLGILETGREMAGWELRSPATARVGKVASASRWPVLVTSPQRGNFPGPGSAIFVQAWSHAQPMERPDEETSVPPRGLCPGGIPTCLFLSSLMPLLGTADGEISQVGRQAFFRRRDEGAEADGQARLDVVNLNIGQS